MHFCIWNIKLHSKKKEKKLQNNGGPHATIPEFRKTKGHQHHISLCHIYGYIDYS